MPAIEHSLNDGPKSTLELEITPAEARALQEAGTVAIDPDRFPDEYVPKNPMVVRLPGDTRPWSGWTHWNV